MAHTENQFALAVPVPGVFDLQGSLFYASAADPRHLRLRLAPYVSVFGGLPITDSELLVELEGCAHPDVDRGKNRRGEYWSFDGRIAGTSVLVYGRYSTERPGKDGGAGFVRIVKERRADAFLRTKQAVKPQPIVLGPGKLKLSRAHFYVEPTLEELPLSLDNYGQRNVELAVPGRIDPVANQYDVLGVYRLDEFVGDTWLLVLRRGYGGSFALDYECEYNVRTRKGNMYYLGSEYKVK